MTDDDEEWAETLERLRQAAEQEAQQRGRVSEEAAMTNNNNDEYAGLSPTWAEACRKADAEARKRKLRSTTNIVSFPTVREAGVPSAATLQREYEALLRARDQHRLAKSVLDLADWLARYKPERLESWLLERPKWERDKLVDYLRGQQK
jgi:hypothetical protein